MGVGVGLVFLRNFNLLAIRSAQDFIRSGGIIFLPDVVVPVFRVHIPASTLASGDRPGPPFV